MRVFLVLAAVGTLSLAEASADQLDPALDGLFSQLRDGTGDPLAIEAEIERRWLTPPEESIAILVGRVIEALDQGEYAVAGVLVNHVTGLAPSYAEGWVLKGRLALAEDDIPGAQTALVKAIDLEPRHYVALELLGDIALSGGDRDRAHTLYRQALDQNPQLQQLRIEADRLRSGLSEQEI